MHAPGSRRYSNVFWAIVLDWSTLCGCALLFFDCFLLTARPRFCQASLPTQEEIALIQSLFAHGVRSLVFIRTNVCGRVNVCLAALIQCALRFSARVRCDVCSPPLMPHSPLSGNVCVHIPSCPDFCVCCAFNFYCSPPDPALLITRDEAVGSPTITRSHIPSCADFQQSLV